MAHCLVVSLWQTARSPPGLAGWLNFEPSRARHQPCASNRLRLTCRSSGRVKARYARFNPPLTSTLDPIEVRSAARASLLSGLAFAAGLGILRIAEGKAAASTEERKKYDMALAPFISEAMLACVLARHDWIKSTSVALWSSRMPQVPVFCRDSSAVRPLSSLAASPRSFKLFAYQYRQDLPPQEPASQSKCPCRSSLRKWRLTPSSSGRTQEAAARPLRRRSCRTLGPGIGNPRTSNTRSPCATRDYLYAERCPASGNL